MQGGLKTSPPYFAAYTPLLFPDNSTSLLYLPFCSIINERPETKFDLLQHKLQFPVTAYVKENNVSFVFECVDMKHDPHIIEYPESGLYLLDIVRNQMDFAKYDYDEMCHVANRLGLTAKEKAFELASWQEFFDWYYDVLEEDYEYAGRKIEGFVIEDSTGYMTKLKWPITISGSSCGAWPRRPSERAISPEPPP